MLYQKYSAMEHYTYEEEVLNDIRSHLPVPMIIEIENKHKSRTARLEKHQKEIQEYGYKPMTQKSLIAFNENLKQIMNEYLLCKTRYDQSAMDGLYYQELKDGFTKEFNQLDAYCSGYYGNNMLFTCFPRLGKREADCQKCFGTNTATRRSSGWSSSFFP